MEATGVDDEQGDGWSKKQRQEKGVHGLHCLYKYENETLLLVDSNLIPENEGILRAFVTKQLNGDLLAKDGKVFSLELSIEDGTTGCSCFYTFLKKTRVPNAPSEDVHDAEASSHRYVVCFLTADLSLELFRLELQEYATMIAKNIDSDEQDNSTKRIHFEGWFDFAVVYISNCLDKLQSEAGKLLHVALMNWTLEIESDDKKTADDIGRFAKICNLPEYLGSIDDETKQPLPEKEGETGKKQAVKITINRNSVQVHVTDCPQYCELLGKDLVKYKSSPHTVKHIIENFKSSIFQDLNLFCRKLNEAEKDYYALYRCHVFLKKLRYSVLILHHVKTLLASNTSAMNVITILEDFTKEKTKILDDP